MQSYLDNKIKSLGIIILLICFAVSLSAASYLPQNINKTVDVYAQVPENAYIMALNVNDSHNYESLLTNYNQGTSLNQDSTTTIDYNGYSYYLTGTETKLNTMGESANMYNVGQLILFSNILNKALDVTISISKNTDNVIGGDIMFSENIVSKSSYISETTTSSETNFTSTITSSNQSYYLVKDIFAKLVYNQTTSSINNTTIKIDLAYN